jgi:hypothetical protein
MEFRPLFGWRERRFPLGSKPRVKGRGQECPRDTILVLFMLACCVQMPAQQASYLGFDRNDYPGDQNLPALHKTFSFSGYWLNNPPGEKANSWRGKRQQLDSAGFGFLVLFNGRLYAELKSVGNAGTLGATDGKDASAAAHREGFPARTIIFLDQEQGGRMLPEQKAYIYAWVDAVSASGFRAGIYCSGIAAKDDGNIVTAADIRKNSDGRDITYFVTDDQCPPSPGCVRPTHVSPSNSQTSFADVWQFAQSPRRAEYTGKCAATYNPDGSCYAPSLAEKIHVDLDSATTSDPSHGRIN